MDNRKKIEADLLKILNDRQSGSRLSRFEDWAATSSNKAVAYGWQFLSSKARSVRTGWPVSGKVVQMIPERREDQRFPMQCALSIRNLTQESDWHTGTLQDISRGGVLVKSHGRFALDDAAEIWVQNAVFLGEAEHTRQDGQNGLVGIRLYHRLDHRALLQVMETFAEFL